jgi:glycogen synthase
VTIPNGVDTTSFAPADLPAVPTILWVGRFFPNKAPDSMLEVFGRLGTPTVRLVLVGDGPMRSELEARVEGNVTFAGAVSEERLRELYAEATLVAVPSRDDGMPTVILEAFASRRPAVAYDVGAIGELVDQSTGALVPAGDQVAMAAAIDELLADSALLDRAAGAARSRAEQFFSWPVVARRTLSVLEGIAR